MADPTRRVDVQNATCSRCKRSLPVTAFKPNPKLRRGLDSWCRSCHNEATARWRESNPRQVEAYNGARRKVKDEKPCAACGQAFTAARTDSRFCDGCYEAYRRARKRGGERRPKTCPQC